MEFKPKVIRVADNGERAILVVDEHGLPIDLPSMYLCTKQDTRSYKTVLNIAKFVCQLHRWADEKGIDLFDRVRSGHIFSMLEIDSLVKYLSFNRRQAGSEENVLKFSGYVSGGTIGLKIDVAKGYFGYLRDIAVVGRPIQDEYHQLIGPAITDLQGALEERKYSGAVQRRMGLERDEQRILLEVTTPGDKDNPFDESTQERNHLFFKILLLSGVRLGELLGLRIEHCNLNGDEPYLKVTQNSGDDRLMVPEAKTVGRRYYLTHQLAREIDKYILGGRKFRGRAARRAKSYLFLNTRLKPEPMTEGAVYHAINMLRAKIPALVKLYPHRLRHTFNDNFKLMFASTMKPEEFAKMQRWMNGWADNSEQGASYTARADEIIGMRMLQSLQDGVLSNDDIQPVDPTIERIDFDEDVPF